MPEEGIKLFSHEESLTFEEIVKVVEYGASMGLEKIRLTGGEPLVRKGIVSLVGMIAGIDGIKDLSMTTNGIFLDKYAAELKAAGLKRINISLDAIDPAKYSEITRGGNIELVKKGIEAAKNAGLFPIKINCVVWKSSDEKDAREVKAFCDENNLQIRYIRWMNLETGEFSVVDGGDGGNCERCNRLRLTANGFLKPCLFNNVGFNIREHGIEGAFRKVIESKPECGSFNSEGSFYNIGG